MDQEARQRNRERMPGVSELIDAHIAAFGTDFIVLRCIDHTTHHRSSLKGQKPYEFSELPVDDKLEQ